MKSTLNELELILNTVELYKDGHYYSDMEKLKQAFHPKAHIVGYSDGQLLFASRDQYLERRAKRKSSAELGEISYTKILSMDKTDTTVVVKIESQISGTRYVSQLSMLKIDDTWQIIAGLFHAEK